VGRRPPPRVLIKLMLAPIVSSPTQPPAAHYSKIYFFSLARLIFVEFFKTDERYVLFVS
jgi:hypothetical protein